jgi:hypothetical protein
MIDALPAFAFPQPTVQSAEWKETQGMIDELIGEARQGLPLQRSTVLPRVDARTFDGPAAIRQISSHPDYTSYHLLWALRQAAPALYESLDTDLKARVFADAITHVQALNDWGYLDPAGSHDGEAARALLALGCAAIAPLKPLLRDDRPAPLFGSEPATLSNSYRYRRKDFAYRYVMLLNGDTPAFDADPAVRDAAIARLAEKLGSHTGGACR